MVALDRIDFQHIATDNLSNSLRQK